MLIVGENSHSLTVLAGSFASQEMEINMSPGSKYLKTYLSEVNMTDSNGFVWVGIRRIRRRLPDGSETPIELENGISHYFNHDISSVTFTIWARHCGGKGTLVIEHWR